jgi:superfamily I DNA and RNA helicase
VFAWDHVLVDEGQDWPEDERDILYQCFGPHRCIVADGVHQLIRGTPLVIGPPQHLPGIVKPFRSAVLCE